MSEESEDPIIYILSFFLFVGAVLTCTGVLMLVKSNSVQQTCTVFDYVIEDRYTEYRNYYDVYEKVWWFGHNRNSTGIVEVEDNFDTYSGAEIWAIDHVEIGAVKECYIYRNYLDSSEDAVTYTSPKVAKRLGLILLVPGIILLVLSIIAAIMWGCFSS